MNREWKKLDCGLFINQKGDLAFATRADIAYKKREDLQTEECPNNFITTFDWNTDKTLKSVIDTSTFQYVGSVYYQDKNQVYTHYAICDAGYFNETNMNPDSFVLFNEHYARYQNKILDYRKGWLKHVDAATFYTDSTMGPFAIDKVGYLEFGERIDLDTNHLSANIINHLKSLKGK